MTATLIAHSSKVLRKPQTVSWAYFQKHFLTKEDGYKYEWLDGEVVKTKAVHVFGGEALKQITVCTGDEICSASPVLNNFELTVNTVLKRPQ